MLHCQLTGQLYYSPAICSICKDTRADFCVRFRGRIYKVARDLCRREEVETVLRVRKSKIGKLSAKGIEYPQLRLPRQYMDTIGKTAEIYETGHDGKRAFLVVTQGRASNSDAVLKPEAEVLKLQPYRSPGQRLSALESQISALKSLIFQGALVSFSYDVAINLLKT